MELKQCTYLSVNVFSTKVLIGDTIFTSPTRDGTSEIAFQEATILLSMHPCATVPNILKEAGNKLKADSR